MSVALPVAAKFSSPSCNNSQQNHHQNNHSAMTTTTPSSPSLNVPHLPYQAHRDQYHASARDQEEVRTPKKSEHRKRLHQNDSRHSQRPSPLTPSSRMLDPPRWGFYSSNSTVLVHDLPSEIKQRSTTTTTNTNTHPHVSTTSSPSPPLPDNSTLSHSLRGRSSSHHRRNSKSPTTDESDHSFVGLERPPSGKRACRSSHSNVSEQVLQNDKNNTFQSRSTSVHHHQRSHTTSDSRRTPTNKMEGRCNNNNIPDDDDGQLSSSAATPMSVSRNKRTRRSISEKTISLDHQVSDDLSPSSVVNEDTSRHRYRHQTQPPSQPPSQSPSQSTERHTAFNLSSREPKELSKSRTTAVLSSSPSTLTGEAEGVPYYRTLTVAVGELPQQRHHGGGTLSIPLPDADGHRSDVSPTSTRPPTTTLSSKSSGSATTTSTTHHPIDILPNSVRLDPGDTHHNDTHQHEGNTSISNNHNNNSNINHERSSQNNTSSHKSTTRIAKPSSPINRPRNSSKHRTPRSIVMHIQSLQNIRLKRSTNALHVDVTFGGRCLTTFIPLPSQTSAFLTHASASPDIYLTFPYSGAEEVFRVALWARRSKLQLFGKSSPDGTRNNNGGDNSDESPGTPGENESRGRNILSTHTSHKIVCECDVPIKHSSIAGVYNETAFMTTPGDLKPSGLIKMQIMFCLSNSKEPTSSHDPPSEILPEISTMSNRPVADCEEKPAADGEHLQILGLRSRLLSDGSPCPKKTEEIPRTESVRQIRPWEKGLTLGEHSSPLPNRKELNDDNNKVDGESSSRSSTHTSSQLSPSLDLLANARLKSLLQKMKNGPIQQQLEATTPTADLALKTPTGGSPKIGRPPMDCSLEKRKRGESHGEVLRSATVPTSPPVKDSSPTPSTPNPIIRDAPSPASSGITPKDIIKTRWQSAKRALLTFVAKKDRASSSSLDILQSASDHANSGESVTHVVKVFIKNVLLTHQLTPDQAKGGAINATRVTRGNHAHILATKSRQLLKDTECRVSFADVELTSTNPCKGIQSVFAFPCTSEQCAFDSVCVELWHVGSDEHLLAQASFALCASPKAALNKRKSARFDALRRATSFGSTGNETNEGKLKLEISDGTQVGEVSYNSSVSILPKNGSRTAWVA